MGILLLLFRFNNNQLTLPIGTSGIYPCYSSTCLLHNIVHTPPWRKVTVMVVDGLVVIMSADSVSNHQRLYCLLNRLLRRRSKKTSKLRVTGLCAGNSRMGRGWGGGGWGWGGGGGVGVGGWGGGGVGWGGVGWWGGVGGGGGWGGGGGGGGGGMIITLG